MRLQLRHVQHAVALAEEGSYTAAARRLNLSQPALSRSIQTLEELLGAPLFDRTSAGIVPTTIGSIVLERGRLLLQDAKSVEREVRLALGLETGSLTIGAGPYPANISVGQACGLLLLDHPRLKVDIRVADWQSLLQAVLDGTLDFAVAEISTIADDSRFETETLPRHPGYFICHPRHPLVRETALTLERVRAFPIVSSSLPARLRGIDAAIRVDTFRLLRDIVIHSNSVGLATASQVRSDEEAGLLARLPLELPWMHSQYGFIRLRNRTPSPAALAFMVRLREVEARLAAESGIFPRSAGSDGA
jgi:DNA-binding transcriptional LysR family regulator